MDSQTEEEKLKQERLRAANRERVRRHRAQHPRPTPIPKPPPLSNAEKVHRYRERKRLARILDSSTSSQAPASILLGPKQDPSRERTRKYRQRRQAQQGYHKGLALSDCERSRRYYAKKQQHRLKNALSSRSSELQENLSTHSHDVGDIFFDNSI